MSGIQKIKYGNKLIIYNITYSNRKSLGITVTPDEKVIVRSPLNLPVQKINEFVRKKLSWISKKLSYFNSFSPLIPERKYISGETHYYLGKQYRLKILNSPLEYVKLKGAYITIYTKKVKDKRIIQILLDNWYFEKAQNIFTTNINEFINKSGFNNFSVKTNIKKMSRRWGSMSAKNNLTLNIELIKTPLMCIKYVIIHELCHLKHRNHDSDFYKLISYFIPDWKQRKSKLDLFVIKLIFNTK